MGPDPGPGKENGLAIHEVSARLGVPAPTLRAWERRYGVPHTPRSAGGHRRYTAEALHEVRLMRDEIARGRRAADAAQEVRRLLAGNDASRDLVAQMLGHSSAMAPDGVRSVLDQAHAQLGLARAIDEVAMPAMRQVGQWWQTGRCDVAQEHLTTEAVRAWLSQVAAHAPAPRRRRPLVFACGPRDLHTLGLEALAVLVAREGWPCRVLGARTPAQTLVTAIRATAACGAVVASHLSVGRRAAAEAIDAAAATGAHVFYGGNAFRSTRSRTGLPGTYLGESIASAAAAVDRELRG